MEYSAKNYPLRFGEGDLFICCTLEQIERLRYSAYCTLVNREIRTAGRDYVLITKTYNLDFRFLILHHISHLHFCYCPVLSLYSFVAT